jgi:hypothetical protein
MKVKGETEAAASFIREGRHERCLLEHLVLLLVISPNRIDRMLDF